MLQSVMFNNNNDFFHSAPSMLEDSVSKYISPDSLDSYMSTSTSPIQEYIMAPSFNPQQQHHNQRQHQIQFPVGPMVSHSKPSSPSFPIKSEEPQHHHNNNNNIDFLMFPTTFDISASSAPAQEHILSTQHSQMQQIPYSNVSLMQQQEQNARFRLQQFQQQQQQQRMMFDSAPAITSAPFFHSSTLVQDDSILPFQRQTSYTLSAHPAAPKRKLEESNIQLQRLPSPQLKIESSVLSEDVHVTLPSRPSTSSRLDKVKPTRSTKITKSFPSPPLSSTDMINSTPEKIALLRSPRKVIKKAPAPESRESSEQPEMSSNSSDFSTVVRPPSQAGNITHPRRAAQNRAAQRTFRNRRKAYIKELEQRVQEIEKNRDYMNAIQSQNQEVQRRFQILESIALQNGLEVPAFPVLPQIVVPSLDFSNGSHVMSNTGATNGSGHGSNGMMNMGGSSNEEDEDEDDMSDSFSNQRAQKL